MTDASIRDFTLDGFVEALELAQQNYRFVGYTDFDFSGPFVLWRHDCDHSLNRALRTAELERDRGVRATYFINPHCNYYNPLEKSQFEIVLQIIGMGHDVGLHLDALFHDIKSEAQLDDIVADEAVWLEEWFDVHPVAFSFHSPTEFCLTCEQERYGGLINTYSDVFKNRIGYCSDSNGYWRHRRLHDVLLSKEHLFLQVLTHPEHWQDLPFHPRERVFRSVYGRADATFERYDQILKEHGRENLAGPQGKLTFLRELDPERFTFLDGLWNRQLYEMLFVELWIFYERQIYDLCRCMIRIDWGVSPERMEPVFADAGTELNSRALLAHVLSRYLDADLAHYDEWHEAYVRMKRGIAIPSKRIAAACAELCDRIEEVASYARDRYGNKTIDLAACREAETDADLNCSAWEAFLARFTSRKD
jgi:hypothetical protein